MTNFKSGDKVELNCSISSFYESVSSGEEIYNNCFIDGVATISEMHGDGGFWLERLDVDNHGADGIRGNEAGFLRKHVQPKPKKTVPFLQTGESFEHTKTLNFIIERMINVHGEHESVDYIHKLRNAIIFIEAIEGSVNTDVECSKQKKTKVEFVRIDFDHAWEAVKFDSEDGLYTGDNNMRLLPKMIVPRFEMGSDFYRKVETKITWKDALCDCVDECKQMEIDTTLSFAACVNGADWDNEFIGMCRVVIAAVDGK